MFKTWITLRMDRMLALSVFVELWATESRLSQALEDAGLRPELVREVQRQRRVRNRKLANAALRAKMR